jgi:hypothetical protein
LYTRPSRWQVGTVSASSAEPPTPAPRVRARSVGRVDWRRRWATLRVFQRALAQCFGARACVWLARGTGISFVLAALYTAGIAPDAIDAVLRLALFALSGCAGLAALSAAGPVPERILESARGLLESRALPLAELHAQRPLAVGLFILRHIGFVALVVLIACLALAREPRGAAYVLRLACGAAGYVVLLSGGLALLAQLCHVLGRARGQSLFLGLVFLPQLLAPAWPELPTIPSCYSAVLDRCLSLEVRS